MKYSSEEAANSPPSPIALKGSSRTLPHPSKERSLTTRLTWSFYNLSYLTTCKVCLRECGLAWLCCYFILEKMVFFGQSGLNILNPTFY